MTVPFLELLPGYLELKEELDAAHRRVMTSGWYLLGEECEAFEIEFARYCGVDHCIAVGSGLDALMIALKAHGIAPGDEVIVPAHTFVATWMAVTHCGATPVPVDVRNDTGNMDAECLEAAFSNRTGAIIPVHIYGQSADMDSIQQSAKKRGIPVIEDAAQAHGARYKGELCGGLSGCAAFSFYPGKNLGAFSDGGAVTTNDSSLAETARRLRNYGSVRRYHHEEIGYNSRFDEIQSAYLRVKLRHLDEWNDRRRKIANHYFERLSDVDAIMLPVVLDWAVPVWHLFSIRSNRRDELQAALAGDGIQTSIHYPVPPHLSDAYAGLGMGRGSFPVAEGIAGQVLSLPIGPHLDDDAVEYICERVIHHSGGYGV